ncbi:MAG: protein kinase domain-containing protein [Streptosporangiaceae bacterium]
MSEDFPVLAGFRAGSLVAGYRLEAQVGAGGMAVVFRARDERLGRLVALKILSPALAADPAFRRRFIAESRAAAVVDNPHIIPVFEAGESSGVLFIAMRFVASGDLRSVLDREGPLPAGRAAGFISPVASALDAAHRAGLVHRDVKPANILVDAGADRPDHVYLSDFGVSKGAVSSVSMTGPGHFLGTPDYSAPEQIQGRAVDGRTDQYALACVAFQLLAGTAPFERDQGMAVLLAHLAEPPPPLASRRSDLPAAVGQVLARAMAKVPEKRYLSCRDFADALRDAFGLPPYTSPGPAWVPGHPPTEPGAPRAGFSALVPAVAAGAAGLPDPAAVLTKDSAPGSGPASAAGVSSAGPGATGHWQDPPAIPLDTSPTITTSGPLIAREPEVVLVQAGTVRPGGEAVAPQSGDVPRGVQPEEPSAIPPDTSSALTGHAPLVTSEPETTPPGAGAVTGEREIVEADPETGPQQLETATPVPGPGPEPTLAPELVLRLEPEIEPEAAVVPLSWADLQDKRRPRMRRALVLGAAAAILIASGATILAVAGSGHHALASLTGTRTSVTPLSSPVTTAPAQSPTTQPTPTATRTTHRPATSSSGRPNAQPTAANTTAQAPTTAPAPPPATSSSKPRPTPTPSQSHPASLTISSSSGVELDGCPYFTGNQEQAYGSADWPTPAELTVLNRSPETLHIGNITWNGVLTWQVSIPPGGKYQTSTHIRHLFMLSGPISGPSGCLRFVYSTAANSQVTVI